MQLGHHWDTVGMQLDIAGQQGSGGQRYQANTCATTQPLKATTSRCNCRCKVQHLQDHQDNHDWDPDALFRRGGQVGNTDQTDGGR